jgi:tetratricopeptide (TPR) repeat protein
MLRNLSVLAIMAVCATAMAEGGKLTSGGLSTEFLTVSDIKDGVIIVQISTGEMKFNLADVTVISLNDSKEFTEAEKLQKTKPVDAARLYSAAIKATTKGNKKLAQYRAIPVMDEAGSYGDAVTNFAELYSVSPTETVWNLRPKKLPTDAKSQYLKDAASAVSSKLSAPAIKTSSDGLKNLNTMLLEIYNAQGNTIEAAKVAKALGVEVAVPEPKGGAAQVPAVGNPAVVAPPVAIPAVGADPKSFRDRAEALQKANQHEEAAATYMSVAAYFPTNKIVASEGLFSALEIQRTLKKDAEAKRLADEIYTKYPDTPASAKLAPLGFSAPKK